jgi:hypothetical protein
MALLRNVACTGSSAVMQVASARIRKNWLKKGLSARRRWSMGVAGWLSYTEQTEVECRNTRRFPTYRVSNPQTPPVDHFPRIRGFP